MRIPEYLSPTSIGLWISDRGEFYKKYLSVNKIPPLPQTQPMSVGSAFDAFVKSMLLDESGGEANFTKIFEDQVEPRNREFALEAGKKCFKQYYETEAFKQILKWIKNSKYAKLEFRITKEIDGIPIQGIPDLYIINDYEHIVHDWKVNGWCAKSKTYPKKGYINLIDSSSKNNGMSHKDSILLTSKSGIVYNAGCTLDEVDSDWARQLTIYAWLMGEEICSEFIASVDQLVCNGEIVGIAQHRYKVNCEFQKNLIGTIHHIWEKIHEGWIFDDLTREESDAKCEELEEFCYVINNDPSYNAVIRG